MIRKLIRSIPGRSRGPLGRLTALVEEVRRAGEALPGLDDGSLRQRAERLGERAARGEALKGSLRAESFALVCEAAARTLGMAPFDVQVAGALVMSDGGVAEMKTGEGKTLTAAMPSFLFALAGKGVHVVTVNDYLAARDAAKIGEIHRFLGLTASAVLADMDDPARRKAYGADVTYGANSQFGFDYLRDNLRFSSGQMVQRGHAFAIVDEADSVLIDEARTPLVISAPTGKGPEAWTAVDRAIAALEPGTDWTVDEREQAAVLTERGIARASAALAAAGLSESADDLYAGQDLALARQVDAALKARAIFADGRDYIVRDGAVVIVDASTGRLMPDRRFSDGIHEALEAKEGLDVKPETAVMSSVTYQNFFRMYGHLCGMTGTALTEKEELGAVYGLDVTAIPTNAPMARRDEDDLVFLTSRARDAAVVADVVAANRARRPVLVGTGSVAASERIAGLLDMAGFVRHDGEAPAGVPTYSLLNARHHEKEAETVALAGLPGAVTIATNMAGRGTDIKLGADGRGEAADEARAAGGLLVLGVGRNDSRRVDNQLRGRSGRQGDPGGSRFYVSLEDDLVRTFAPEKSRRMIARLGLPEDQAISHPIVSGAIEQAQKAVESRNYETRKNVVKYDDVVDQQRRAIHSMRREIMASDDVQETVHGMIANCVGRIMDARMPENSMPGQWDVDGLARDLRETLRLDLPVAAWAEEDGVTEEDVEDRIMEAARARLRDAEAAMPPGVMRVAEKQALMVSLDTVWRQHLGVLEELRASVGFRSMAQRDPLVEFRTDAYDLFERTMAALAADTAAMAMRIEPRIPAPAAA